MQDFRRLHVWSRAHQLGLAVRRAAQRFPRFGYAEQRDQLTSAAESIASNIVEGCGASSAKEFARYLDISIKSATELEYRLQLARDSGVLPEPTWRALSRETVEVRKMLYGLRRKVLGPPPPPPPEPPTPKDE